VVLAAPTTTRRTPRRGRSLHLGDSGGGAPPSWRRKQINKKKWANTVSPRHSQQWSRMLKVRGSRITYALLGSTEQRLSSMSTNVDWECPNSYKYYWTKKLMKRWSLNILPIVKMSLSWVIYILICCRWSTVMNLVVQNLLQGGDVLQTCISKDSFLEARDSPELS